MSISLKLSGLSASGNNLVILSGNVTFSVVGLLTTDSFALTFLSTLRSRRNLLVSFKELAGRNLRRSPTRGVELLAAEAAVSTLS